MLSLESYGVVANHELAHAISAAIFPHQPRWLAEALACYFEMAAADPETHEVTIGVPFPPRLKLLSSQDPLSLRQLFACKQTSCADDLFYSWSWALFAYLLDKHFDRFALYLQSLQDHDPAALGQWRT